jgi:hypothetical protein
VFFFLTKICEVSQKKTMGREKWIFFLKLIMAMDSMASFGTSLQGLLPSNNALAM